MPEDPRFYCNARTTIKDAQNYNLDAHLLGRWITESSIHILESLH